MRDWWPRILILGLLAAIIGLPLLLRPSSASSSAGHAAAGGAAERLVLMTPHTETIRYEFERGFNRWRASQHLPAVEFDWRFGGSTTDLRKQIIAEFESAARAGKEADGIGKDLFFGGGEFDHNILAGGLKVKRDGQEQKLAMLQPIELPVADWSAAFPQPTIGGELLYHKDRLWVGTALSSFGIVYNRDNLKMLGLPEPTTWSDLGDARYRQWIALGDPAHSSSVAAAYQIVLRRLGWGEGWAALRRIFANARYFTATSSKVPVDVSSGEAAAGMCIDFYGRSQCSAIGPRLGYVDPPFMTAITADPISFLRGAPHQQTAQQFIAFVVSPEGQRLWQARRGTPGGPERFELRRLPIRRDLYNAEEMKNWADQTLPFEIAKPYPPGTPDYFLTIAPLSHAMAIDVHSDLIAAWEAICRHPDHPQRRKMLDLFYAMPPELTVKWPAGLAGSWKQAMEDASDPRHEQVVTTLKAFLAGLTAPWSDKDKMLADRLRWTGFFRERYREVVRVAE